jgi:hypothetical protein
MIIIRPLDINPGVGPELIDDNLANVIDFADDQMHVFEDGLMATNVPAFDPAEPEWDVGTTYAEDAIVTVLGATQRRYQSLAAGNLGNDPTTSPLSWADLGVTNRWRMFDGGTSTLTTNPDSITVAVHSTQYINALALFNVGATEVEIKVYRDTQLLHTTKVDLRVTADDANWYAYFYGSTGEAFDPIRDFVDLSIPGGYGQRVEMTFTRTGEDVEVGLIVLGRQQKLGDTMFGSRIGITDYSRKDVDEFGNFTVTERRFSKRAELDVMVRTPDVSKVQRALSQIRATPTVYVGSDWADVSRENPTYEETIVYGYYRDFMVVLETAGISTCSIDIEGL